jgi:hypothetical protein
VILRLEHEDLPLPLRPRLRPRARGVAARVLEADLDVRHLDAEQLLEALYRGVLLGGQLLANPRQARVVFVLALVAAEHDGGEQQDGNPLPHRSGLRSKRRTA